MIWFTGFEFKQPKMSLKSKVMANCVTMVSIAATGVVCGDLWKRTVTKVFDYSMFLVLKIRPIVTN